MKIKDIALSAAYVGQRVVKAICVGAHEIWSAIKYIVFKDPVVEKICATNWGDGTGLTEEQAASVTSIGNAFEGNTEITSFEEFELFVGLNRFGSNGYAFYNCSSLESISIPHTVTMIQDASFWNCKKLKNVKFPPNITKYGHYCFRDCENLTYAPFPEGLTVIDSNAFIGSGLQGDIVLPSTIQTAGGLNGTKISSIYIPDHITSLPISCFHACGQLKSCHLPANLTSIGESAFQYCALESLDIPANVTSIGNYAFYVGLKSDATIICHAIVPPTAGSLIFHGFTGLIYVPDQSVQAYREASGWLSYADKIKPLSQYVES